MIIKIFDVLPGLYNINWKTLPGLFTFQRKPNLNLLLEDLNQGIILVAFQINYGSNTTSSKSLLERPADNISSSVALAALNQRKRNRINTESVDFVSFS